MSKTPFTFEKLLNQMKNVSMKNWQVKTTLKCSGRLQFVFKINQTMFLSQAYS